MKIIKATVKNIPDLVFLNSFVQVIHANQYPDVFKSEPSEQELTDLFQTVIGDEKSIVFMAIKEEISVGYLWATFGKNRENPFKYEQSQVYIHHVVVQEEYRKQGTGSKLFSAIEKFAREKGISRIALDTWIFNDNAHSFFEKHGYKVYKTCMEKRINT